MGRPKIEIKLDDWDRISEILSGFGIFLLILMPVYYYPDLPETIPRHFNSSGAPDSFGSRSILWLLPIIGIILYLGLSVLNRYPHIFNYAVKITDHNAYKQYKNATKMIRTIKLIVVFTFCFIMYVILQTALGRMDGLPQAFMVVFPMIILGSTLYFLFRSMTIRDK